MKRFLILLVASIMMAGVISSCASFNPATYEKCNAMKIGNHRAPNAGR